jgi:N-acetylmuramoyl-L-alanine amidase
VNAASEDEIETTLLSFDGFQGTVVGDVCNLREGPSTDYRTKGVVYQGNTVEIISSEGEWLHIRTGGKDAWIAGWLIDIDLSSKGVRARVVKTDVNLRVGPGLNYPVNRVTQRDRVYLAEAKRGQWIRIATEDSKSLWVHEPLVQLEYARQEVQAGTLVLYPTQQSLPITQSPILGSTTLATLKKGESAVITGSRGPFLSVETVLGTRGWVYGPNATIKSTSDNGLSMSIGESAWTIGKSSTATVVRTNVNFRSGPGTNYSVLGMLQKGDTLQVLGSVNGWIKGIAPDGITGYVAEWLTSGVTSPSSPSFNVSLDASGDSRLLTVTGPFDSAAILPGPTQDSFLISTSEFFKTEVEVPVNAYEFSSLKVATSDVTVGLLGNSNYTVKTNSPGKVVLEFRPRVKSVNVSVEEDKEILTIDTLGYVEPTVQRKGNTLTFFLPGASLTDEPIEVSSINTGQTIRAVNVVAVEGGMNVTLNTPSDAAFVVKKTANHLEVHFSRPGLQGKTIVIDPGHDSDDPGAIGYNGVIERDVNWEIAIRLKKLLENAGATVHMTRTSVRGPSEPPSDWTPDPTVYSGSLAKRAAWSESADLFLSIHNDWHSNRTVSGTTAYITEGTLNYSESSRLAWLIRQELCAALATMDKDTRHAGFFVTRESRCPAVLVEVMYLSNANEESRLRQEATWEQAAEGLLNAIQLYFTPSVEFPNV